MQTEHVRVSSAMIVKAPIALLLSRGSSATQLFAKQISNKGMSVQFPPGSPGLPPPGAWPSLIGKGASATPPGSTPLRTRSGQGWPRIQQRSKRLIVSGAIK